MPILSQVRSTCMKDDFSIKTCLHLSYSPPPLLHLSCAPRGGLCVPVSAEDLLTIPCDIYSVIYISLLFKSLYRLPPSKAPLQDYSFWYLSFQHLHFCETRKSDSYLLLRVLFLFPIGFFFFVSLIATSSLFALDNRFDLLHSLLSRVP